MSKFRHGGKSPYGWVEKAMGEKALGEKANGEKAVGE